jgi:enamine deaminase RidA (YjgF/YER057c/UK114 family)
MGEQLRQCYANAAELLKRFDASLDDVVDEVIYVVDADAGDAAAGPVRKEAYGRPDPQVASTMIGTSSAGLPRATGRGQTRRPSLTGRFPVGS